MVQFKDDSLNDKQLCGYFCCALSSSFSFGKTVVELGSSVIKKPSLHAHQLLKTIPSFHKTLLALDASTAVVLLVCCWKDLEQVISWSKLVCCQLMSVVLHQFAPVANLAPATRESGNWGYRKGFLYYRNEWQGSFSFLCDYISCIPHFWSFSHTASRAQHAARKD